MVTINDSAYSQLRRLSNVYYYAKTREEVAENIEELKEIIKLMEYKNRLIVWPTNLNSLGLARACQVAKCPAPVTHVIAIRRNNGGLIHHTHYDSQLERTVCCPISPSAIPIYDTIMGFM